MNQPHQGPSEAGAKQRIWGILNYRRPTFWAAAAAVLLCAAVGIGFLTNPQKQVPPQNTVTGPGVVSRGALYFAVPEGCSYDPASGELRDGTAILGGVYDFPLAEEPEGLKWLHELPLPEWSEAEVGYFADGTGRRYSIEFFSDVPPETPRTLLHEHYLFWEEGRIYGLWVDALAQNKALLAVVPDSLSIGSPNLQYSGVPAQVYEIGTLPEGFTWTSGEDGSILFEFDGKTVGGITAYAIPAGVYDPEDRHFGWLEKLGIPDYGELDFYGGMTFFDDSWSADFGCESPHVLHNHHFLVAGNRVYDTWFDGLTVDHEAQSDIRKVLHCTLRGTAPDAGTTIHSQSNAEEAAWQAIDSFRRSLEGNGVCVISHRSQDGAKAPRDQVTECWLSEAGGLKTVISQDDDGRNRTEATMMYEGVRYTNEGHEYDEGDIFWQEIPGEFSAPWLFSFDWGRQNVSYIDTLHNGGTVTYMFRVDYLYDEGDERGYWVNWDFTEEGQFISVKLQVNLFLDNAYTVTESLLTVDTAAANERLDAEMAAIQAQ